MDLNTTSRIFVDVSSKLLILSKAQRVGKGTYTVSQLVELAKEKDNEGYCVMMRPKNVGGYVLACGNQVIAIAIMNPPSMGKKALENIDENPLIGDLYLVPKDVVKEALKKLKAEEAVSGVSEQVSKAIQAVKDKLSTQAEKKEEKGEEGLMEVELPESATEVPKLEIFDMIDAVTLADELAYYLSKKGYKVSSEPPDMVGNTFLITLRLEDDVTDLRTFIKDTLEEAKRINCENLIKIKTNSDEIIIDPVLFEKLMTVVSSVSRGGYCYIKPQGEDTAILQVNLDEEITAKMLTALRNYIRKMLIKRQLPWKKILVSVSTPSTSYHEVG